MEDTTSSPPLGVGLHKKEEAVKSGDTALARILKYSGVRLVSLAITVVIGLYLTILIANMGGYVDQIRKAAIQEEVNQRVATDPTMRNMTAAVKKARIDEMIALADHYFGLDQPFLPRTFFYLGDAITLNLGRALEMTSNSGSTQVRLILLERIPPTLLLFATAALILFFLALFAALVLSRRYGSFLDKSLIALTPLSSAPGWFYGIFLILIFASVLKVLPFGGMTDSPPPSDTFLFILSLLKHLTLPVLAITLSSIFLDIFTWRTFFLIYSSEDYVDMAKAKGLPSNEIESRYILRPTLPTIITSFALLVIGVWTGAPILETIFNWPGLGRALYQAVSEFDTPVIIGSTVIYSYLLALTVFLLDFFYALVDPRVKIGGEKHPE